MYKTHKILGIIPARGGSKGLPRKNIRLLGGKPLIAWTIEEAKKSRYIDRLILSSEDAEIIQTAKGLGCEVPFIRPMELAQDDTIGIEPVLHALNMLQGYDYLVLLQPTSPLRIAADIDGAIETCIRKNAKVCVTVTEPDKSPYWMFKIDTKGRLQPLIETGKDINRRQNLPKVYALNGAVYVAACEWLLQNKTFITSETMAFEMPRERSIDIDSGLDFTLAEFYVGRRRNKIELSPEK